MLSIIALLLIINILLSLLTIHHQDFRVASRYSVSTQTVIATGNWYGLYGFLLLAILGSIFNLFACWRLVLIERTRVATAALILTIFMLGTVILYSHAVISLASSF
jgi:hypothetical protein